MKQPNIQFKRWYLENFSIYINQGLVFVDESESFGTLKNAYRIAHDSRFSVGTICVWESGELELEVLHLEFGRILWHYHEFDPMTELSGDGTFLNLMNEYIERMVCSETDKLAEWAVELNQS